MAARSPFGTAWTSLVQAAARTQPRKRTGFDADSAPRLGLVALNKQPETPYRGLILPQPVSLVRVEKQAEHDGSAPGRATGREPPCNKHLYSLLLYCLYPSMPVKLLIGPSVPPFTIKSPQFHVPAIAVSNHRRMHLSNRPKITLTRSRTAIDSNLHRAAVDRQRRLVLHKVDVLSIACNSVS